MIDKTLNVGPSAYSCLGRLPDGSIGCLYETGAKLYQKIAFARFGMDWLQEKSPKD